MREIRHTKIPYEGGSGRVPSGVLQFERDWPGLWLRGDETNTLESFLRAVQDDYIGRAGMEGMVNVAQRYIDMISATYHDTKTKGHPHDV